MITYADQTGFFDPNNFTWPVHVIGVGGIGSAVLLPLVKLGLKTELHLWDPDIVEPHNIPAQLIYRRSDIGMVKVEAAAEMLEPYKEPACTVVTHQERVDESTQLSGVVIAGVDSMAARHAIWKAVQFNIDVPLYMDGRIGGERAQLFTLNPFDHQAGEFYSQWLFDDSEAAPLPCAERTVIHPPVVLAGLMIGQLTRFARELPATPFIDSHLRVPQFVTIN